MSCQWRPCRTLDDLLPVFVPSLSSCVSTCQRSLQTLCFLLSFVLCFALSLLLYVLPFEIWSSAISSRDRCGKKKERSAVACALTGEKGRCSPVSTLYRAPRRAPILAPLPSLPSPTTACVQLTITAIVVIHTATVSSRSTSLPQQSASSAR